MEEGGLRYCDFAQLGMELNRVYHATAVELGMPDSVLGLLVTIYEEGDGFTPSQLYAKWSLSKQTGHGALKWLEERGLIRLRPDPKCRRSKGVFLTVHGQEYARRMVAPLLAAEEAAFGGLTEEEQRELVRLTEKMLCKLKEEIAGIAFPAKKDL